MLMLTFGLDLKPGLCRVNAVPGRKPGNIEFFLPALVPPGDGLPPLAAEFPYLSGPSTPWVARIFCPDPPEDWSDPSRYAWVTWTALEMPSLEGAEVHFPHLRSLIEASALFVLRREGAIT